MPSYERARKMASEEPEQRNGGGVPQRGTG